MINRVCEWFRVVGYITDTPARKGIWQSEKKARRVFELIKHSVWCGIQAIELQGWSGPRVVRCGPV